MTITDAAMRFSPSRTHVIFRGKPELGAAAGDAEGAADALAKPLSPAMGAAGDATDDGPDGAGEPGVARNAAGEAVVRTNDFGQTILERDVAFLPDPRYSGGGHIVQTAVWYGGFLLSLLYVVCVFVWYTPEQSFAVVETAALDPRVPLRLVVACSNAMAVTVRLNYSDAASPCHPKASAGAYGGTAGVKDWKRQVAAGAAATFDDVPLCYAPSTVYHSNEQRPSAA
jgi:hypothetical protein